jgi:DNA-binding XRE family transcriptional regulator
MRNRLREERMAQGVSVTELKRRSGVSRQTIYTIENEPAYTPLGSVMANLANALGVEIGDIFSRETPESEPVEAIAS